MRRGPEDVPVDRSLLVSVTFATAVLSLLLGLLLPAQSGPTVVPALLTLALTLVWVHLMLKLANKPERFMQTATAVLGFQVVLAPLLMLTAWLIFRFGADKSWQLLVLLLRLVVEVWVLAVTTRILRSATGWSTGVCVALTIALELFTYLVIVTLFVQVPEAPVPG